MQLAARIVDFAPDVEIAELEIWVPRRDVTLAPLDAGSDYVDSEIMALGPEDFGQPDSVAAYAAADLEHMVVWSDGAVLLVLEKMTNRNVVPCVLAATGHPGKIDRNFESVVGESCTHGLAPCPVR
jgi:hypothetical protein